MEYRYDVPADGTPVIFPLQEGDGIYTIKAMENVESTKYRPLFTLDCEVKLQALLWPYRIPSSPSCGPAIRWTMTGIRNVCG